MQDLRSPERKAAWDAEQAKEKRESARQQEIIAAWHDQHDGSWHPIETCPFEALDNECGGLDGVIWVTDGTDVALASVSKRFGRPIRVVTEPEQAITDRGVELIGGEFAEIEAPTWWLNWELTDQFGNMTYAGGHETGKEEVEFVATHWMPAKPKPPMS